jgi:hypothetical protein
MASLLPSRHTLARPLQLEATSVSESDDLARCRARLQHLQGLGPPPKDGQIEWSRRRIDRLLVDHLLRAGHKRTAAGLAATAGIEVGAWLGAWTSVGCEAQA